MMRSILLVGFAVAVGFGAGFLRTSGSSLPIEPPTDRDLAAFSPQLLDEPPGADFDLVAEVDWSGQGAIRLFSDAHAERKDYLFAELDGRGIRICAVEAGLLRVLAEHPQPPSSAKRLRLRRRTPYLDLIVDGERVLRAVHAGFVNGRTGTGGRDVSIQNPTVQPFAPVVFADDFMRGTAEAGPWVASEGGQWEVRSLQNPARSSNAFVYQATAAAGGISLVGRPYWDAYRAEVAVLGTDNGDVGLAVAASDLPREGKLPERFCFVRWSCSGQDALSVRLKSVAEDQKIQTIKTVREVTGLGLAEAKALVDAVPSEVKTNLAPEEAMRIANRLRETGADADIEGSRLEIVLVRDRVPTVLAVRQGGYRPGQWYRMSATLNDCRVVIEIDGHEMLAAEHPALSGGCAGLFVKSAGTTEFDDFKAIGIEHAGAGNGALDLPCGTWRSEGPDLVGQAGDVPALALVGRDWANVTVRADDLLNAGLVVAYRNPSEYVALVREGTNGKLLQVRQGAGDVLAEGPLPAGEVELTLDRGVLRAGMLTAFVPNLPPGRVGVLVPAGGEGRCRGLSARTLDPPLPVVSINEVFDEEDLMQIWSGVGGDWKAFDKRPAGYEAAYWHRAPFFGDAEIEALLPAERRDDWALGLSLAKEERKTGYIFMIRPGEKNKGLHLKLFRDEVVVAEQVLPEAPPPLHLRLRKAGPLLIGLLDDRVALSWRDDQPLTGTQVAWAVRGVKLEPEKVQIYSRSLISDSFNSAPADWRNAGGVWQVANRWECDPRWSFMAGMPPELAQRRAEALRDRLRDTEGGEWIVKALEAQLAVVPDRESKLAGLWHKRSFPGDVVAECFIGQMMDQSRGGGNYMRYVQNLCLTLSGDGNDLSSGYELVFGGEENKRSMILRRGKVVAESNQGIPNRDIHRKWFRLRGERIGSKVRFQVFLQDHRNQPENNLLDLSYDDPDPLPGDRVAVWSYNSGLLVARARISGTPGRLEDPLQEHPAVAPCYYTSATRDKGDGK